MGPLTHFLSAVSLCLLSEKQKQRPILPLQVSFGCECNQRLLSVIYNCLRMYVLLFSIKQIAVTL